MVQGVSSGVAKRVVVAGFSQGGAMALHTLLHHNQTLGGVMVLSGYLLCPDRFEARNAANRQTRVLYCHGSEDDVVPLDRGKRAFTKLEKAGFDAHWSEFPMAHSHCMPEVRQIASWLATLNS